MGCDIHIHIEVKFAGQWHHYSQLQGNRNYQLFAKMAGVRNSDEFYVEPLSPPKGLPVDITFLTDYDNKHWGSDAHSHSYLNAEEIAQLAEWTRSPDRTRRFDDNPFWLDRYFGYLYRQGFEDFAKNPEEFPGLEDLRFVFWFDN